MEYHDAIRGHLITYLTTSTWAQLPIEFKKLDLPWKDRGEIGKEKHLNAIFYELDNAQVLAAGRRLVAHVGPSSITGASVQDAISWIENKGRRRITEVTRVGVAHALDRAKVRLSGAARSLEEFEAAVRARRSGHGDPFGIFPLESFVYGQTGLITLAAVAPEASFNVFHPTERWVEATHNAYFRDWGVYKWPDARFALLLETAVHPLWRQGADQARVVDLFNECLRPDGLHLRQVGTESGHPVYGVRALGVGVPGRPKNLIFASDGPKPVIGMVDAVNNDIVTLDNEDSCLVYDDDIDEDIGLTWNTLVSWWTRTRGASEDPGRSLAWRLKKSLDRTYEVPFFDAYYRAFRDKLGEHLPALIPQVYLHYDPRWRGQRGDTSRFHVERMDFLVLLPNRVRVVVEVDGIQHYAVKRSEGWSPDPEVYARTTAGDRSLRLRGYEVYRFGGAELQPDRVAEAVATFFEALFVRHNVGQSTR